jgi:hypothetical protein
MKSVNGLVGQLRYLQKMFALIWIDGGPVLLTNGGREMKRTFCDGCKVEMLAGDNGRAQHVIYKKGAATIEVDLSAHNTEANGGDLCKYCVLDAVLSLDDRPRAA